MQDLLRAPTGRRPDAARAPGRPGLGIVGPLLGRHPGRVTSQGEILAERFAADGHRVRMVSEALSPYLRLAETVAGLTRWGRDVDILIVQVYGGRSFVLEDVASALGRRLGPRLVLHCHGGAMPDFLARFPRWGRRVLARADALVAPSSYLADALRAFGVPAAVIPNHIDVDAYPFRRRPVTGPRLFWMRSFHPIYNPSLALRTLARLRERFPGATLVLAGQSKGLEPGLRREAEELGVAGAVRFAGFLDHAAKLRESAAADVFLNTNRVDNAPVAVLEAWALGLPVVATAVGGVPHLVCDGETGLLVPDDDADAMAAAVARLVAEPDLVDRLTAAGRSVAERSRWDCVRRAWEDVFARVLTRPGAAAGTASNEGSAD